WRGTRTHGFRQVMPKIELWGQLSLRIAATPDRENAGTEALPSRISTNFDSGSNQIQRFQTKNGTRILDHSNFAEEEDIRKLSCCQVRQLAEQSCSATEKILLFVF